MTTKRWRRLSGVLAVAVAGSLVGWGFAQAADEPAPGALKRVWEGNVLHVDYTGTRLREVVVPNDSFHHEPAAVPGDLVHRSLSVKNDGPCAADLTVAVTNPVSAEEEETVNGGPSGFEDLSAIRWDVGGSRGSAVFSDLVREGGRTLATVTIPQGQSKSVALAYAFDFDATDGKHLGFASQTLGYDVRLVLRGETCAAEAPPPGERPPLERTGSNWLLAALSAVFLIVAGVRLVAAGRTRRRVAAGRLG
jgi:hypothetical protein